MESSKYNKGQTPALARKGIPDVLENSNGTDGKANPEMSGRIT